jgi:site-specific recombinase XerD
VNLERTIERFILLERSRGRSEGYLNRYPALVRGVVRFLHGRGKDDLREATTEDVVAYLAMLEEHQKRTSVTNVFFQLRRFLGYLQREGLLLRNPLAGLRRRRDARRIRAWLSEEEATSLLEAQETTTPRGLRNRALLEILYSCGLRVGELVALDLDDVDLGERLVTVRRSKSGRFRRVPIGKKAAAAVASYLADSRPRLMAAPTVALFLGVAGRRIARSAVETIVASAGERAGLAKRVTPHVLRHTAAVHLLRNGAPTRYIQELLGHRHLSSTQVYTHVIPQDLKRAHRRSHPAERAAPMKGEPPP